MFFLRDLPKDHELLSLSRRYDNMKPSATKACLLIMRIGSDISQAFESLLRKDCLSLGRFLSLMLLNRNPETALSPSLLADKVGVTRPTMTGLLDGLVKDKLVKRYSADDDRRKLLVQITAKGRKRLDSILPQYYQLISELLSNLSQDEQETLASLMIKAFPEVY